MRGKPESTNTHRNQEKEFPNCLPDVNLKQDRLIILFCSQCLTVCLPTLPNNYHGTDECCSQSDCDIGVAFQPLL